MTMQSMLRTHADRLWDAAQVLRRRNAWKVELGTVERRWTRRDGVAVRGRVVLALEHEKLAHAAYYRNDWLKRRMPRPESAAEILAELSELEHMHGEPPSATPRIRRRRGTPAHMTWDVLAALRAAGAWRMERLSFHAGNLHCSANLSFGPKASMTCSFYATRGAGGGAWTNFDAFVVATERALTRAGYRATASSPRRIALYRTFGRLSPSFTRAQARFLEQLVDRAARVVP